MVSCLCWNHACNPTQKWYTLHYTSPFKTIKSIFTARSGVSSRTACVTRSWLLGAVWPKGQLPHRTRVGILGLVLACSSSRTPSLNLLRLVQCTHWPKGQRACWRHQASCIRVSWWRNHREGSSTWYSHSQIFQCQPQRCWVSWNLSLSKYAGWGAGGSEWMMDLWKGRFCN